MPPIEGVRLSRTTASRLSAACHDNAELVEPRLTRHRGKFDTSPFAGTTEAANQSFACDLL
jgi:hypothetical protein